MASDRKTTASGLWCMKYGRRLVPLPDCRLRGSVDFYYRNPREIAFNTREALVDIWWRMNYKLHGVTLDFLMDCKCYEWLVSSYRDEMGGKEATLTRPRPSKLNCPPIANARNSCCLFSGMALQNMLSRFKEFRRSQYLEKFEKSNWAD